MMILHRIMFKYTYLKLITTPRLCCRYWAITDPFTYPSRMSDTREECERPARAQLACRIFIHPISTLICESWPGQIFKVNSKF